MPDIVDEYFQALNRLKVGNPKVVKKGTKITNDAVSLEAGRKKGTIKKSRTIFTELIAAISAASDLDLEPEQVHKDKMMTAKNETAKYRALWEESIAREVSLVKQLWSEREEWAGEKSALTGEKVSSILGRKMSSR